MKSYKDGDDENQIDPLDINSVSPLSAKYSLRTETDFSFAKLADLLKSKNLKNTIPQISKFYRYSSSNNLNITPGEIPEDFWRLIIDFCINCMRISNGDVIVSRVIMSLSSIVDLIPENDLMIFVDAGIISAACSLAPYDRPHFRAAIYLIAKILQHSLGLNEFLERFPFNDLPAIIKDDDGGNEIGALFYVLSKSDECYRIKENFIFIFKMYMERDNPPPPIIMLFNTFYERDGFINEEIWDIVMSLLSKVTHKSKVTLFRSLCPLVDKEISHFLPYIDQIVESVMKRSQEREVFDSGCTLVSLIIRTIGTEFPGEYMIKMAKEIINRLSEAQYESISEMINCLDTIIVFSSASDILYYAEISVHLEIINFIESENPNISTAAMDILMEMHRTLMGSYKKSIVGDSLSSEQVDNIKSLSVSSDKDQMEAAQSLLTSLSLSDD